MSGAPTPLELHLAFRAQAKTVLKDDPDHSIWEQVVAMFWRDAAYRIFNEARRHADAKKPNAAIAPLLGEFVDQAYVWGEIVAIGRLTDPAADDPARGVVSLPTVLKLVRDQRDSLTRELFVTYDGTPYDSEPGKAAARAAISPGVRWVAREPWEDAEDRHALFDRLSRKAPDKRRPDDIVHRAVLTACETRLRVPAIRKFRKLRNKVVSHAASAESRGDLGAFGLSMAAVDEAHRAVIEVTETLSAVALGEILVGGPVAIPQYDVLKDLEHPFAFAGDLDRLQGLWSDHTKERDGWSAGAVAAVLSR